MSTLGDEIVPVTDPDSNIAIRLGIRDRAEMAARVSPERKSSYVHLKS